MNNLGIIIRLTNAKDPKLVLNIHHKKELLSGKVAFSTDLIFSINEVMGVEKIVFFFEGDRGKVYAMADVLDFKTKESKFLPIEWKEWIPEEYPEERNSWFLIKNMRIVEENELKPYVYARDNDLELLDIVKQNRFPRAYFKRKMEGIPSLF